MELTKPMLTISDFEELSEQYLYLRLPISRLDRVENGGSRIGVSVNTNFGWCTYGLGVICPGVGTRNMPGVVELILKDAALLAGGDFDISPEVLEIVMKVLV